VSLTWRDRVSGLSPAVAAITKAGKIFGDYLMTAESVAKISHMAGRPMSDQQQFACFTDDVLVFVWTIGRLATWMLFSSSFSLHLASFL